MADVNRIMTMGLPPRYRKPAGTLIVNRNGNSSLSWLDVEGSMKNNIQPAMSSHRRAFTDSLTLLGKPKTTGGTGSGGGGGGGGIGGEVGSSKVDLKPSDGDVSPSPKVDKSKKTENSSPLSDKNPSSDRGVVVASDSSIIAEPEMYTQYKWARKIDPDMDPKKIKRILANRQSAHKSRLRKLEYMAALERSVNSLQAEISITSPQASYYDRQRQRLRIENNNMKQRMACLMSEKLFKDAQFEVLKEERERLMQIYMLQQRQQLQQQQQQQQLQQQLQQEMVGFDLGQEQFLNINSMNQDS